VAGPFKALLRRIARRLHDSAAADLSRVTARPELVVGLKDARIHPGARLTVDGETASRERIVLGNGVYLGAGVELAALAGGAIAIGDDTSLQAGCLVGGDVMIGAHCLFGKYVFVSSTQHRFRDRPSWLIRDQDGLAWSNPGALGSPRSSKIVIEDDCWIGQGVVINPGVTVGRGAVIGANSVVTQDVPPYEVWGGVPARRINTRLEFAPPAALDAKKDDHLPYFYRGFRLSQADLATSRAEGTIAGSGNACLIMAAGSGAVRLTGKNTGPLEIRINGADSGRRAEPGVFDLRIAIPRHAAPEGLLSGHTVIELSSPLPYGVTSAMLETAP
jgi:acetyltransferase-like isoleucine patch superfamily enzyme